MGLIHKLLWQGKGDDIVCLHLRQDCSCITVVPNMGKQHITKGMDSRREREYHDVIVYDGFVRQIKV